ncbi:MAG: hypothetical protein NUV97_03510 [archaeon]|nr:hypothetical protein [archaeon]
MSEEVDIIKEVSDWGDSYSISLKGGLGFGLDKSYGYKPKAGDEITLHTKGFSLIRGIDVNGKKLYWKTDEDLEKERIEWLRKNEEDKQKRFEVEVEGMDLKYNSLPKVFQERINRFRENNDRFRIDYEGYELFCCEQAVLIAKACETKEGVQKFKDTEKFEEQMKMVPGLSDGHSGNTFGCACSLAYWYLEQPEIVKDMHGALSPLVGSREYGDHKPDAPETF